MAVGDVRALFDEDAKVGIALGGWNDTAGFGVGARDGESRKKYAKNVAEMADTYGFDFVGMSSLLQV